MSSSIDFDCRRGDAPSLPVMFVGHSVKMLLPSFLPSFLPSLPGKSRSSQVAFVRSYSLLCHGSVRVRPSVGPKRAGGERQARKRGRTARRRLGTGRRGRIEMRARGVRRADGRTDGGRLAQSFSSIGFRSLPLPRPRPPQRRFLQAAMASAVVGGRGRAGLQAGRQACSSGRAGFC